MIPAFVFFPPEINSALIFGGPGAGPLFEAASAWDGLAVELSSSASSFHTTVSDLAGSAWMGPSSMAMTAAAAPYVQWLIIAAAQAEVAALQARIAALAFEGALVATVPLPQVLANRARLLVLIATNFFGINTIPIALNEADYVRMWVQAATTMATYQAVSGSALASAPRTTTAPPVLKTNNMASAATNPPSSGNFLTDMFNQLIQLIQNPAQTLNAIMANPSAWFPLLFFIVYQAIFQPVGWTTWSLILSAPAWIPIILGLALNAAAALGGPALLPAAVAASGTPAASAAGLPAAGVASTGTATPTAAGSTPTAGTAPASAPVATPAAGSFAYMVGGFGPDDGPGPTLIDREAAKAPGSYIPAAAAVGAVSRDKARARRRRRAEMHDHADEFADMDSNLGPITEDASVLASERGGGSLGFVGTVRKGTAAEAAGLATLSGTGLGAGPTMPMVPGTWSPDTTEGEGDHS
jgi:PPE-repeat protein